MSLMLRKYCQPTLDRAGLGAYHVAMTDKARNLVIAGECGKPLLTAAGISFPKVSPTKGEIEYAQELLVEFLRVHKPTVDKYLKLHNRFLALPTPVEKQENFLIDSSHQGYPVVYSYAAHYADGCIQYRISEKSMTASPNGFLPKTTVADVDTNTVTPEIHEGAMSLFKIFLAWKKIEGELESMRESLSSCDI